MRKLIVIIVAIILLQSCSSTRKGFCPTTHKDFWYKGQGAKMPANVKRNLRGV